MNNMRPQFARYKAASSSFGEVIVEVEVHSGQEFSLLNV
jgi:hypothetical protein